MSVPVRTLLRETHVAAVIIAVLLFSTLDTLFQSLWFSAEPILRNYTEDAMGVTGQFRLPPGQIQQIIAWASGPALLRGLAEWGAAWLLSQWVYGEGPLRSLARYRTRIARKTHA